MHPPFYVVDHKVGDRPPVYGERRSIRRHFPTRLRLDPADCGEAQVHRLPVQDTVHVKHKVRQIAPFDRLRLWFGRLRPGQTTDEMP